MVIITTVSTIIIIMIVKMYHDINNSNVNGELYLTSRININTYEYVWISVLLISTNSRVIYISVNKILSMT